MALCRIAHHDAYPLAHLPCRCCCYRCFSRLRCSAVHVAWLVVRREKTTGTIVGLQAGLILLLLIAGAGVGSLLLASEVAFNIVKTVGALYLIYLGWSQWRARVAVAPQVATPTAAHVPSWRKRFLLGFLTNATNPKGVIFMVAVLPQFIVQSAPLLPQLLILAITMCTIDVIVMHGYALAASALQRFFHDAHAVKKQNRLLGGLLMAIGAGLFFVKRTAAT